MNELPHDALVSAQISAPILLALEPFISYQGVNTAAHCVHFEPHPLGVVAIATDGVTLAACLDRRGHCKDAFSALVPDAIFDACRPVELPRLFSEGCEIAAPEPPPWCVPDMVWCHTAGVMVMPKPEEIDGKTEVRGLLGDRIRASGNVHLLGIDYRIFEFGMPHWRNVLHRPRGPQSRLLLDPCLLHRFGFTGANAKLAVFAPGKSDDPYLIRSEANPDFIGAVMGRTAGTTTPDEAELVPEWTKQRAASVTSEAVN